MGSMMLPILKAVEEVATKSTPGVHHGPSTEDAYGCQGHIFHRVGHCKPNGWSPSGEHGSCMGTCEQKVNTITSTNIQHNASVEGSTLKDKTHLRRTYDIIGIYLRRHLELRFCCCGTVARPTEPLIESLRINFSGRTSSCWPNAAEPTELAAIVTVIVGGSLEHTTGTGGVVVAAVTGDFMKNTLQWQNIYYKKSYAEYRKTSRDEYQLIPPEQRLNHT